MSGLVENLQSQSRTLERYVTKLEGVEDIGSCPAEVNRLDKFDSYEDNLKEIKAALR